MNRAKQPGEDRHKPAGITPAKHRKERSRQQGEAWAVGTIGLGGLLLILYATGLYAGW
jgi:hypothetical protein